MKRSSVLTLFNVSSPCMFVLTSYAKKKTNFGRLILTSKRRLILVKLYMYSQVILATKLMCKVFYFRRLLSVTILGHQKVLKELEKILLDFFLWK